MPTALFPTGIVAEREEQPDSGEVDMQPNGQITLSRHWKYYNYETALNNAPTPGDVDFLLTTVRCFNTKIKPLPKGESPGFADVVSQYLGFFSLPPARVELTTNRLDRPIEQHPQWNNTAKFGFWTDDAGTPKTRIKDPDAVGTVGAFSFKAWTSDSEFRGIEAYMVASYQWKVTDYLTNWDNPGSGLFKIDDPPFVLLPNGITAYPDDLNDSKWLKVQHDVQSVLFGRTSLFERTRCWLFSDVGWKPAVYEP